MMPVLLMLALAKVDAQDSDRAPGRERERDPCTPARASGSLWPG